ncbi:MAG: FGGY family carbohydrate kinase, partial [Solirubrobacteraceae bacterium]
MAAGRGAGAAEQTSPAQGRTPPKPPRPFVAEFRHVTVLFGIDVGTSATKGLAITPDGDVVATEEVSYPLSTPKPGWSEQDPEDWW